MKLLKFPSIPARNTIVNANLANLRKDYLSRIAKQIKDEITVDILYQELYLRDIYSEGVGNDLQCWPLD